MKLKLLYLLAFGLIISQNSKAQNLDSGLVRDYPFNGNAYDLSMYSDTGEVISATLTSDRKGNPNSAYSFDGSTSHIKFDTMGIVNEEFSVSIWARYNGSNPGGLIYLGNANSEDQGITTGAGSNGWTVGSYNTDNSLFNILSGEAPTLEWTHLVFVRTNTAIKLYIDGVFHDSTSTNGKMAGFGTAPLGVIGMRSNGQFMFSGDLDDIKIYNRPVTNAEALLLYQGPSTFVNNKLEDINISVFPNPAKAGQIIKFTSAEKIQTIEVFDISGKQQNIEYDNNSGTLSGLEAGIYITRIQTDSGYATKKIVVQ